MEVGVEISAGHCRVHVEISTWWRWTSLPSSGWGRWRYVGGGDIHLVGAERLWVVTCGERVGPQILSSVATKYKIQMHGNAKTKTQALSFG